MSCNSATQDSEALIIPIVVIFLPDKVQLLSLIKLLTSQLNQVIIIDNCLSINLDEVFIDLDQDKIQLIKQIENIGLAKAINIGVMRAKKLNASHVLIFDQDSLPVSDMIPNLFNALVKLKDEGKKVAAVGPKYVDERTNSESPFVHLKGLRQIKYYCDTSDVILVDRLITSGSLIPIEALDDIGLMNDELFIDYVDTDWGFRAIKKGYHLYGVGNAKLKHELGEYPLKVLGKKISLHSPLRNYYQLRNGCYLLRKNYTSLSWKIIDGYRMILKYFFYSIFVKPRLKRWRMMTLGILHAMQDRMGKYKGL